MVSTEDFYKSLKNFKHVFDTYNKDLPIEKRAFSFSWVIETENKGKIQIDILFDKIYFTISNIKINDHNLIFDFNMLNLDPQSLTENYNIKSIKQYGLLETFNNIISDKTLELL